MDILLAADIGNSDTPTFPALCFNEHPDPEPPPTHELDVVDVPDHECTFDATHPIRTTFVTNKYSPPPDRPPNHSHNLWDTHMFPAHELYEC